MFSVADECVCVNGRQESFPLVNLFYTQHGLYVYLFDAALHEAQRS